MSRPRRGRLPIVVAIAALGVVLSDGTRTFGIQGELTILIFGITVAVLANGAARPSPNNNSSVEPRTGVLMMPPLPLILFGLWAVCSLIYQGVYEQTYQNLIVYLTFILAIPAAAAATSASTSERALRAFRAAGVAAAFIYLALVAALGPNAEAFYSARAIAGSLLTGIAVMIAMVAVLKSPRWPLVLMFLALTLSLSRSATAIALVLMMTFAVRGRPGAAIAKSIGLAGVIAAAVVLAYQYYEPFRNRFEVGDGYQVGGFTLGTSGRSTLWAIAYNHWLESPWIGFGAGSVEQYTLARYFTTSHPHNDYLRLLHDFGLIGLALWVAGMVALAVGAYRRYKVSTGFDQAIHLAAMLMLLKLALFMVANNPVVGIFGMLATGAILGLSMARDPTREDRSRGVERSREHVLPTRAVRDHRAGSAG